MGKVMIYGATSYTGGLISEGAKYTRLDFVLAGRIHSSLQLIAVTLDIPYRVFDLNNSDLIDLSLDRITTLLNCAGPFVRTAEPLIEAYIRNGIHYLDTSTELGTYILDKLNDSKAKAANVMLLPGCGGSIATFGCLVSRALKNLGDVQSIDLALHVSGLMSRGSATTVREGLATECLQRRNRELTTQKLLVLHCSILLTVGDP
jgi:short subunit dehydrogenase-like uncharacterized protein